jgi:hypothetical protein
MKKPLTCLLLIWLVSSTTAVLAFQRATGWVDFVSTEGGYRSRFPSEPALSKQDATSGAGEKITQFVATANDGNAGYMSGYFDIGSASGYSLDKARDTMVQAVNGNLNKEVSISLGEYPGRELTISASGGDGVDYILHARLYLVRNRVFILQVAVPKNEDQVTLEKVTKYFESFQLLSTPEQAVAQHGRSCEKKRPV